MCSVVDPDAEVSALYERANANEECPMSPLSLAYRLLGPEGIELASSLPTAAVYSSERRCILVRRANRSWTAFGWVVLHELAEMHCQTLGYDGPDRESLCNRIAARLAAPRAAVRLATQQTDGSIGGIAEWLRITETVAALRKGEVFGTPLVLVTPDWLAFRGDAYAWPNEKTLRRVASLRERAPVNVVPLTDARRRVALIAL